MKYVAHSHSQISKFALLWRRTFQLSDECGQLSIPGVTILRDPGADSSWHSGGEGKSTRVKKYCAKKAPGSPRMGADSEKDGDDPQTIRMEPRERNQYGCRSDGFIRPLKKDLIKTSNHFPETSCSQPRPQGFSLKKWVGRPIHFLREKPWGRGWSCSDLNCVKRLYNSL